MELEREARKSRFARPNQLPDTEPVAPKLLREKAPDALEDMAPHIVPASPMMFGPNITGSANRSRSYDDVSGAFYKGGGRGYNHYEQTGIDSISFSASRSNSTYGSSSTVQPPSLALLGLIKI